MAKHRFVGGSVGGSKLSRAIALALAGAASADAAAQAASPELQEIEIVVVTGSYIRGTAEDAALPVDVVTAEDLAKQGSPTMVDLVKSIPAVQGIAGESNQFAAGQTTGTSNINLRGLGPTRTLVLMNGRRMAPSANRAIGVDTNLIPTAAIGRIEVLKDGAAATYGSDAIGGVVNFITRKGFEGFSVDGTYSYIEGSDGDYGANLVWGHDTDDYDVLLTAGYRHRSELSTTDRDYAVNPRSVNPQGGWSSFGNPGVYTAGATLTSRFADPACTNLGGELAGTATAPSCFFQYITFDNLVEIEDHYQAYGEFNTTFGDDVDFHVEAFYGAHDVEEENSSPSYAPNQGFALTPQGRVSSPSYFIPIDNPGLVALLPSLPAATQAAIAAAPASAVNGGRRSIVASGLTWRPFGNGGNPLTGEGKQDQRNFEAYRVSTSLSGQIAGDIGWDVGLTYMEGSSDIATPDILVSRLQRALSGFGGPNCTGTTPGANGCMYLNPFSTGISQNPSTGAQNSATFAAGTVNDLALVDWLFEDYAIQDKSTLLAADLVFNGDFGFNIGSGDNIAWAFGGQYREDGIERKVSDFNNIALNPCPDTPLTGNTNCPNGQSGAFSFFGPLNEQDLSQDVFGVFGELNVPFGKSFSAQIALRYEDYGGQVGSTTNPKVSLRWQAADWLALRGSVGSTFRGPPQNQLLTGFATGLAFTAQSAGYKPYDTYGNPDLKPEEADTFNVGFIVNVGAFKATLDYWSFDFTDPIGTEGGTRLVDAFFGAQGTPAQDHCNEADYQALQQRFTFSGGVGDPATCAIANLIRTRVNTINGPKTKVNGIDASFLYAFDNVLGGALTLGIDGTYNLKYEVEDLFAEGILIEAGDDYAGTRGGQGTIPELRGSTYIDFATSRQGVRWTTRYIDGVEDVRTSVLAGQPGKNVGSFLTHDLTYRLDLPGETTLGASVFNVTDEDPPFVRLDLSYDPFIGNPLGRYYKMTLTKRF